jgi:hypothetical protein
MNETALSKIFYNENLLPAQFFTAHPEEGRIEPLKKLAFAVLVDAVHVFQLNLETSRADGKRQLAEAREWLLGAPGHGPFSFENVCYVLGIEPSGLRSWLLRWQAMKRAGQPCRVWARRTPVKVIGPLRPRSPRRSKRACA